jgi:hypothetical protein
MEQSIRAAFDSGDLPAAAEQAEPVLEAFLDQRVSDQTRESALAGRLWGTRLWKGQLARIAYSASTTWPLNGIIVDADSITEEMEWWIAARSLLAHLIAGPEDYKRLFPTRASWLTGPTGYGFFPSTGIDGLRRAARFLASNLGSSVPKDSLLFEHLSFTSVNIDTDALTLISPPVVSFLRTEQPALGNSRIVIEFPKKLEGTITTASICETSWLEELYREYAAGQKVQINLP